MDEPVADVLPSRSAWRGAFVGGVGCGLGAGLIAAVIDAAGAAAGPAGWGALTTVMGLWALPCLAFAVYAGLVAAGVTATLGPRPMARLREDRALDAGIAAAVVAALIVLLALPFALGPAVKLLVVKAQRKDAGAAVVPMVAIIAVIGLALLAIPLGRGLRRALAAVPDLGPLSRTVAVAILGAIVVVVRARHVLYHAGFETKALPLGGIAELALEPVLTVALAALCYGPLAGIRRRVPFGGALVGAGAAAALVLGALVLTQEPSAKVADSVTGHGGASRLLVMVGQSLIDRDHDGYSPFFRGPDCNDHDANVHPNAKEIAGNGIDENCEFGDAKPIAQDAGVGSGSGSAGGSGSGAPPPDAAAEPAKPKQNVVIIMIDTLRVDRLGASGYQRDGKSLTPRIDGFLQQAVWFRRTYAQANNTPRSMPSFMTSRYPTLVKVDKVYAKYPRVDDANDMLFERLQAGGLHTVGEASHFYFRPDRNFTQGFDEFDNDGALDIGPSNKDSAAPRIVPRVVARLTDLGKSKQPFAMFVHLFEPHSSFVEHEGMPPITEKGTAAHAQRYDYEVAFVDGWVGKIFDAIDAAGLADDTVVVLMSDHGEDFGDHSFAGQSMFHGTNLYDEQIRVPFAFRVPGVAPRQVDSVVQLLDLAPTVADLAGVAPSPAWLGRSLVPAIHGDTLPPRPAFSELLAYPGWDQDLKAAISGDGAWKLIHVLSQRRYELYDLADDPHEHDDRWGKADAAAKQAEMMDLMASFVDGILAQ